MPAQKTITEHFYSSELGRNIGNAEPFYSQKNKFKKIRKLGLVLQVCYLRFLCFPLQTEAR